MPEDRVSETELSLFNQECLLQDLGLNEDALICVENMISLRSDFEGYWLLKGLLLARMDRHDEAICCFDKAIELSSDNPGETLNGASWYLKGLCLIENDETPLPEDAMWTEALKCFDNSLEVDSMHARSWVEKGRCLIGLSDIDTAIECINKAVRMDPSVSSDSDVNFMLGIAFYMKEQMEKAVEAFDQELRLDPSHAGSSIYKAAALCELSRYEEALGTIDEYLESYPEDLDGLNAKANVLAMTERFEEALYYVEKALLFGPRDPELNEKRAFCLLMIGREKEAWIAFDLVEEIRNCETERLEPYLMPETVELSEGERYITPAELRFSDLDCLDLGEYIFLKGIANVTSVENKRGQLFRSESRREFCTCYMVNNSFTIPYPEVLFIAEKGQINYQAGPVNVHDPLAISIRKTLNWHSERLCADLGIEGEDKPEGLEMLFEEKRIYALPEPIIKAKKT